LGLKARRVSGSKIAKKLWMLMQTTNSAASLTKLLIGGTVYRCSDFYFNVLQWQIRSKLDNN